MSKLYVANYQVIYPTGLPIPETLPTGKYHSYLVFDQDGDQNTQFDQTIIRGGPADRVNADGPISVQIASSSDSIDGLNNINDSPVENPNGGFFGENDKNYDGVADTLGSRNYTELASATLASSLWNEMLSYANELQGMQTEYFGLGPNSNSTINSVMNAVGLNYRANLPTGMNPIDYPGHLGLLDGSGDNTLTAFIYSDGTISETTVFRKYDGDDTILLEWNNATDEHAQLEVINEFDSTGLTTVYFDGLTFADVDFDTDGNDLKVTMGLNPLNDDLVRITDFYLDRSTDAAEGAQTTAFEFEDLYVRIGDGQNNVFHLSAALSSSVKPVLFDGDAGMDLLNIDADMSIKNGQRVVVTNNDMATAPTEPADNTAFDIETFDVLSTNNGFFDIRTMGHHFDEYLLQNSSEEPVSYTTLSYHNYSESLTFAFTTPSTSKDTQIYDQSGNIDTFDEMVSVVGSQHGDTYYLRPYSGYGGSTSITKGAHFKLPIFTGNGDDTIVYDSTSSNSVNQPIMYGGGNDTVYADDNFSTLPRFEWIMPLGAEVSDISYTPYNVRIESQSSNNTTYVADLDVTVDGWGTITYVDGLKHTENTSIHNPPIDRIVGGPVGYVMTQTDVLQVAFEAHITSKDPFPSASTFQLVTTSLNDVPLGSKINAEAFFEDSSTGLQYYKGTFNDDVIDLDLFTYFPNFMGYDGNDIITTGSNDNVIYAGGGFDRVVFNNSKVSYTISGSAEALQVSGEGLDDLHNVELLQFSDISLTPQSLFNAEIDGSGSSETLDGTEYGEIIAGLGGDDVLNGFEGADSLFGGDGDDTLFGGLGDDFLQGDLGYDTASFTGDFSLYTLFENGSSVTSITGAEGHDFLLGIEKLEFADGTYENGVFTPASNTAPVAADDDFTGSGGQTISGNVLADNGYGADSDGDGDGLSVVAETLTTPNNGTVILNADGTFTYTPSFGFSGTDSFTYTLIDGNGGSDTGQVTLQSTYENIITGTAGGETLDGGTTQDFIDGGAGNDTLKGREGNDTLFGNTGDDTLWGNEGDDTLVGGRDADWIKGSGGVDTYVYQDILDGGDTIVDFRPNQGETIDVSAILTGAPGFVGASAFTNGFLRLAQTGSDVEVYIDPDGTDGTVSGETLLATLESADVNDIDLNNFVLPNDSPVNPYHIYGTSAGETLDGTANDETFYGGDGDDTLKGREGNDTLFGQGDNDTLWGNEGDDILVGGHGADWMKGSAGIDTYVYQDVLDAGDTIVDFRPNQGETIDVSAILSGVPGFVGASAFTNGFLALVQTGSDVELYIDKDGAAGTGSGQTLLATLESVDVNDIDLDNFILPDNAPLIPDQIYGTSAGETLDGTANDEVFYGDAGNDTLKGREGHDVLYGQSGDDTLWGNDGDDILIGGDGADWIKGSSGVDTYVYQNVLDGGDTIVDFRPNQDEKIDVSGILSDAPGFVESDVFNDGFLRLAQTGSDVELYIDPDGTAGIATGETLLATLESVDVNDIGVDSFIFTEGSIPASHNIISGTTGADTLTGHWDGQREILYGDTGDDLFTVLFGNGDNYDVIQDFDATIDGGSGKTVETIDISDVLDNTSWDGQSATLSEYVTLGDAGSHTYLQIDTDGTASGATFTPVLRLEGHAGLDLNDLALITEVI